MANRMVSTSENANFNAGEMVGTPFMFSLSADTANVYMHSYQNYERVVPGDPIEKAFNRNFVHPIMKTFKIKASRKDTLLIDMTSFFVSNEKCITPIRQSVNTRSTKSASFDASASKLMGVKSFEKNLEITSRLNYNAVGSLHRADAPLYRGSAQGAHEDALSGQPRGILQHQVLHLFVQQGLHRPQGVHPPLARGAQGRGPAEVLQRRAG